jgi:hypothetical protein
MMDDGEAAFRAGLSSGVILMSLEDKQGQRTGLFNARDLPTQIETAFSPNFDVAKDIFLKDRAALGVIAALMMTINFGALMIAPDEGVSEPSWLIWAFVLFHAIGGISALTAIWVGAYQYLKANMLPPRHVLCYMREVPSIVEPIYWMTVSVVCLPFGVLLGVWRVQGDVAATVGGLAFLGIFSLAVFGVTRSILTFRRLMPTGRVANPPERGETDPADK